MEKKTGIAVLIGAAALALVGGIAATVVGLKKKAAEQQNLELGECEFIMEDDSDSVPVDDAE